MANNKRKQDEKHLKMLRDMVSLPSNKQCFDCHQRGPTYVNMTIGSFVCTSCSGVLRGLNPPHRIKSISMASFTPEEMDFLKSHGNELNRKVFLGQYDGKSWPEPDSRNEQHVKEFMVQKYEGKRWYVAPTEAMKEEAKWTNEAALNSSKPQGKPTRAGLGDGVPKGTVGFGQVTSTGSAPVQVSVPLPGGITSPPPISMTQASVPSAKSAKASSGLDLFGDLGGDPFTSNAFTDSSSSVGDTADGFADFSNFGSMSSEPPQPTVAAAAAPAPMPVAPTPLAFTLSSTPLAPVTRGQTPKSTTAPQAAAQPVASLTGNDKYAAFADLDSAFSAPVTTATSINWGGGGIESNTINWGGTTSGSASTPSHNMTGSGWGTTNSPINWGSQGSSSVAAPPTSSSMFGTPSTVSNPFGGVPAATGLSLAGPTSGSSSNPFGGGSAPPTQQFSQAGITGAAGFGAQFAMPGQSNGFGQFPSAQNGGFGVGPAPGGFRGPGSFSQQQQFMMPAQTVGAAQQIGGWGQLGGGGGGFASQPVANPFMNTNIHQQVPPPSGSTNPFL